MTANSSDTDYSNFLEATAQTTKAFELQARAISEAIPDAVGAASVAQHARAIGSVIELSAFGYQYLTAPDGQQNAAAFNYAADKIVESLVSGFVLWKTKPLGSASTYLAATAGSATSVALQWMDIDYAKAFVATYEILNPNAVQAGRLTTTATTTSNIKLEKIVDLSTSQITFKANNTEVLNVQVGPNSEISQLTLKKGGIEASFHFDTGNYSVTSSDGITSSGNLTDTAIDQSTQNKLNIIMDAFDAEFGAQNTTFAGIRTLFPALSYQASTGFSKAITAGWGVYTNGDFTYRYDTNSTHFEIASKSVNAHYGANGVQTIMYTDPTNSQWYFLQVSPDGSKFLAYAGHETGVSFNKFGELPDHYQGALQRMEMGVNAQIGDKVHSFFVSHPSENTNLPGILAAMTGDAGVSAVPPVPGRKPHVSGQTDTESSDNGVTYSLSEERTVIINNQTYRLQQFSSRVDVDSFSNLELKKLVQGDYAGYTPENGDDIRIRALSELAIRWSQTPQALLTDGLAFVPASNGGALSAVLVSGQSAIGSITAIQKGNFKIQAVETIGAGDNADIVQVITEDTYAGTGARSQVLNITYPENFNFQYAGGYFGGLLGGIAADDNLFKQVVYKALFTTVGETVGTFADFVAIPQNTIEAARYGATQGMDTALRDDIPDLSTRLAGNLAATLANVLGQKIVDHLTDAVNVHGVTGEIFDVAVGTVTIGAINEFLNFTFRGIDGGVYSHLLSNGFDFNQPISPNSQTTIGDAIKSQMLTTLAAYAGTRLAGELISPESQQAAIFGSIGSALATSIASNAGMLANMAISQAVSGALKAAFGATMSPIIGAAIGAFVGQVLGTAIGNMFASHDEPISWATVKYDGSSKSFYLNAAWGDDGGNPDVAHNMANALLGGVNDIIDLTGGTLRRNASGPTVELGLDGNRFGVIVDGKPAHYFNSAAEAIQDAALQLLKGFDLVGGYAILMRAWHNSDAVTLDDFKHDLEVAEAFQAYLANPAGILALMMDQPQSPAALAWAKVLQRASELQLHVPSEHDLDGGWAEVLAARGNIDPSLIPNIDGEAIVVTDPATGEQIRLEHVIGPGYEIVRVPGTDGNDIINLVVDGPSITYVDAMGGDDIINGSDQRDIILGGTGNDTINGNAGDDWINGGSGDDTINGNGGLDLIYGSDDNDVLTGAEQNDDIYGGAGNDTLRGMGGFDQLHGGDGDDLLLSTEDYPGDALYGDAGNDTIDVDTRYSQIYGGSGNDTIILRDHSNKIHVSRTEGHDIIQLAPNPYTNYLEFDRSISINDLWFQRSGDDLKILVLASPQSVTVKNYYLTPNLWISAKDAYLDLNAANLAVHQYFSQFEQPSGPNNYLPDSVLQQINPGTIWGLNYSETGLPSLILAPATGSYTGTSAYNRIIIGTSANEAFAQSGGASITIYAGAGNDTLVGDQNVILSNQAFFYGDAGNDSITGSIANDELYGGTGADSLYGQRGDDILMGESGDDNLHGGNDLDKLYGGDGNDSLNGDLHEDQLYGGDGDDVLYDLSGSNVMYGEAGNDTLTAGSGDDVLDGGDGIDTLNAGGGNDRVVGGNGQDVLNGDAGNDIISGSDGDDILNGNGGNDTVQGGEGNDLLIYTVAENQGVDDTYNGGNGADTLRLNLTSTDLTDPHMVGDLLRFRFRVAEHLASASSGFLSYTFALFSLTVIALDALVVTANATEVSLAYNDISGTSAADALTGSSTHDQISGADGNDTINADDGDDIILGGNGDDIISTGTGWNLAQGDAGNDNLTGGDDQDELSGGDGNDTVIGAGGNDQLFGDDGADDLEGQAGNDILKGGLGSDSLLGGDGNDTLLGQADNDTLNGNSGDDVLDGGSGDDLIRGAAGNDTLTGSYGSDTFFWTAGDLEGGLDSISDFDASAGDKLSFDNLLTFRSAAGHSIDDFIRIALDNNVATLSLDFDGLATASAFISVATLLNGSTIPSVSAMLAAGTIIINPINHSPVVVDDHFTVLRDSMVSGNVLLANGLGPDTDPDTDALAVQPLVLTTLHGGQVQLQSNGLFTYAPELGYVGVDTFNYVLLDAFGASSTGTVQITLQPRANDIVGTAAADSIYGNSANNTIIGLDGVDTVRGSSGNDTIYGGQGDDDIRGNTGSDELFGGSGNDRVEGNEDNDILHGGSGDDIIRGLIGNDIHYGDAGDDDIRGSEGDDVLYGGAGSDAVYGDYNSADTIEGNDIIDGGDGNDRLYGGLGNDTYFASAGTDYVSDRSGADILRFADSTRAENLQFLIDPTDATDLFIDFHAGIDRLHIENAIGATTTNFIEDIIFADHSSLSLDRYSTWMLGTAAGETLNGSYTLDDTILAGDGADSIYGKDGNDELFGGEGDDYLRGDAGHDMLVGGNGDDYLRGNDGNDTLIAGAGTNRVEGGAGADAFIYYSDAPFSGLNRILDFNKAEADKIILDDVLVGYDPLTDVIGEFITLSQSSLHTYVNIDRDGQGTEYSLQNVIRIENRLGQWTDVNDMIAQNHLEVA